MVETLKTGGTPPSASTSINLPGRKLATSKNPRMLTRSEIDLLRQDLKAALNVVGQDEIEDAQGLFRRHGFRSSDFEIFQQGDPSPAFVNPVTGMVVVLRKSNRIARTYEAGHGTKWLLELETDLKMKAFGD